MLASFGRLALYTAMFPFPELPIFKRIFACTLVGVIGTVFIFIGMIILVLILLGALAFDFIDTFVATPMQWLRNRFTPKPKTK